MKIIGFIKGEIKKWFSDIRYNQRNLKSNQCLYFNNDFFVIIIIDFSDEILEFLAVVVLQQKQFWNFFFDFVFQKFKEKIVE